MSLQDGPLKTCIICMDEVATTDGALTLSCNHTYCARCLRRAIKTSLNDESRFPPRCCELIPINDHRALLGREIVSNFNAKSVEHGTNAAERVYCANPACAIFLTPRTTIQKDVRWCNKYGTSTCTLCKGTAHLLSDCPKDPSIIQFNEYVNKNGLRKCPKCGSMLEHEGGCEHMICRFGCQFCYNCGAAPWKSCTCPRFDPARRGFALGEFPPEPVRRRRPTEEEIHAEDARIIAQVFAHEAEIRDQMLNHVAPIPWNFDRPILPTAPPPAQYVQPFTALPAAFYGQVRPQEANNRVQWQNPTVMNAQNHLCGQMLPVFQPNAPQPFQRIQPRAARRTTPAQTVTRFQGGQAPLVPANTRRTICDHNSFKGLRGDGPYQCGICGHNMPHFIMACRVCQLRYCNRCKEMHT